MSHVDTPVTNISLCSGGGGLDLGLQLVLPRFHTVAWVEWEAFAIDYLATAMEDGHLAAAPIWTDLRTFDGKPWRHRVDFLTAGYPCQPFSLSGKRRGEDDPRHLWPHVARIIKEVEPRFVFLENVAGHVSLGFETVADDLQRLGFRLAAGLFTAAEVGTPHERKRLFILAMADSQCSGRRAGDPARRDMERLDDSVQVQWQEDSGRVGECREAMANWLFPPRPDDTNAWFKALAHDSALAPAQSEVCFMAHGLAHTRTNYLRLLGNGVVPLAAAYAFLTLYSDLT